MGVFYCTVGSHQEVFIGIHAAIFFIGRKAGLRLGTSPLPVNGSASLILMRKYEVTEFLGWGFPTVGSHQDVFIGIQQYFL